MHVTRRFWTLASVAVFLAVTAVLFDRPFLLVGAVGIGAWLVGTQYAFAWTLVRLDDRLRIEQSVSPERGFTTQQYRVTLSASAVEALPFPVTVSARPSPSVVGLDDDEGECRLSAGTERTETTGTFRSPVAGRVEFDAPEVRVTDEFGLFGESFRRGESATATVEPPRPTDIRTGRGSEFSASDSNRRSELGISSLVYRGIREYVPSDPANQIDWRATARLGDPHVVEFETHTDQQVELVVDRRPEMTVGEPGRTKLDYAREVALSIVDSLEGNRDAVGLLAFDEDGVRTVRDPRSNRDWYATLRALVRDQMTVPAADGTAFAASASSSGRLATPEAGPRAARVLREDHTSFGASIRPFVDDDRVAFGRTEEDPFSAAVDAVTRRLSGQVWTVVFTDESDPARTRESVKRARRVNDRVVVFLTPTVLFDPDALDDVEEAYERYRAFESYRRKLDGLARVDAHEISPGDRVDTVLSSVQTQQ
ncbi:DUF58 domain-containing protein [Halogeometricum sp. CBA1124]|uniref:DUF58 domain-containing protein n=1 Tax=Halogeometricum sp. CBA1124 TaxID=2668071 RepID=UPI00142C2D03|nr:DUF58 domain-containing protein [Halogeometricum sp. CBA1124]MUV57104.1 DUF58 domain-containing protein [Halogeometricum sp. CBA1124]